MSKAYSEGREAYGDWHEAKGGTCIDGTEPDNPYPEGTPEHEDWDRGRGDERDTCALIDMGR